MLLQTREHEGALGGANEGSAIGWHSGRHLPLELVASLSLNERALKRQFTCRRSRDVSVASRAGSRGHDELCRHANEAAVGAGNWSHGWPAADPRSTQPSVGSLADRLRRPDLRIEEAADRQLL